MHAVGLFGGQTQSEQRTHRKAGDEKMLDALAQKVGRRLHAGKPILGIAREQVVHGAAVPRQLHAVDRESGIVESLAEHAHFVRRSSQAMDQQHAAGATFKQEIAFLDHRTPPNEETAAGTSRAVLWPSLCAQGFNDLSTPGIPTRCASPGGDDHDESARPHGSRRRSG